MYGFKESLEERMSFFFLCLSVNFHVVLKANMLNIHLSVLSGPGNKEMLIRISESFIEGVPDFYRGAKDGEQAGQSGWE